jgi:hypothetical protein
MAKKSSKVNYSTTIDFQDMPDEMIMLLWLQIEKEFKKRKIKFRVGDVGESIAIDFFNNKPGLDNLLKATTGTKNVDALSKKGDRYSIKTIREGTKTSTIYPGPDKDKQLFEYLLLVLLDDNLELKALYRFSWKQFLEARQWDITMSAWYIPKTKKAFVIGETIYEK